MSSSSQMYSSNRDQYLEAEVLGASPVKLVNLLYRGAIESVSAARRYLAAGDVARRSRQIMKTWEILHELTSSLNPSRGGELSTQLAQLYAYMQRRLIDANTRQIDAPLAEVEALLTTLSEAWRDLLLSQPTAPPPTVEYHRVSCSY